MEEVSRFCPTSDKGFDTRPRQIPSIHSNPFLKQRKPAIINRNSNHSSAIIPVRVTNRQVTLSNRSRGACSSNLVNIKTLNVRHDNISIKQCISTPSFFLSNVCHITNKVDELFGVLSVNDPTVVMITESWLSTSVPDSLVNIRDYNLFRLDRTTPGGGVLAYVNSCIPVERLLNLEVEGNEVLWLVLKPPRTPRPFSVIIVVIVYYPPGQLRDRDNDIIEYLSNGLDDLLRERPSAGILIAGDFNKLNLSRLCSRFSLRKLVVAPTRGNSTLDQIITNMSNLYEPVCHLPPIGRSDHQSILLKPKIRLKVSPIPKTVREMKPGNWIALGMKMLLEDWSAVFSAQDVDEKVVVFNDLVLDMLNSAMPERTVRFHPSDKPWMTCYIKSQLKARQRAFCRGDQPTYERLRLSVSSLVSKAKAVYYQNTAKNYRNSNPEKWFKSVTALAGANVTSASLTSTPNGNLSDLAEKLQAAFIKPWKNLDTDIAQQLQLNDIQHLLKDVIAPLPSIGQVKMALKQLKTKKATGVDGIPAWLLKNYCEDLAPVVHNIVVCSIIQCKYPTGYKHALITPIAKVHPPIDIENDFRQISVLPQLAKVLEKIQLRLNIEDLKLKDNQHAFLHQRSTVSALISTSQKWFNATDNSKSGKKGIHAVFIDFRKAFDLVDHKILLHKLALMKVSKPFWTWIQSFLSGRTQQVKLFNHLSTSAMCPAGVPQGSVISPMLFNVHIDDLEDAIPNPMNINTCKYADDCTIDQAVGAVDTNYIQDAVDAILTWAALNKMVINVRKTKDMWICFTDSILEPPPVLINDEVVERVDAFKLLGVWFQNNLKWNTHTEVITRKANRLLFLLRECRKSHLPCEVGLTLFLSKIRPIVEYASPVWGGLPSFLDNEIARIQKRSLRILGLDGDILPDLSARRVASTKCEAEKLMNDLSHPCRSLFPEPNHHEHNLRGNKRNGRISIFSGTERHKRSFLARACELL